MDTVPCHGTGKRHDCLNGVKERPMPVIFKDAPAALDRIVLTMVWRGIGQAHTYVILVHKLDQPLHKLRAPTMILRAIIQIDDERGNVRQALTAVSHHWTIRSTRQSLVTLEVMPYTN